VAIINKNKNFKSYSIIATARLVTDDAYTVGAKLS